MLPSVPAAYLPRPWPVPLPTQLTHVCVDLASRCGSVALHAMTAASGKHGTPAAAAAAAAEPPAPPLTPTAPFHIERNLETAAVVTARLALANYILSELHEAALDALDTEVGGWLQHRHGVDLCSHTKRVAVCRSCWRH